MKHALILLVVAMITLSVVFIIYRPDLLEDIWLWLIGLAGPIIGAFKQTIKSILQFFNSVDQDA